MYAQVSRNLSSAVNGWTSFSSPATASRKTRRLSVFVLLYVLGCVAMSLFLLSYLGEWLPLADALAVFRLHLAIMAGTVALLLPAKGKTAFGAILALAAVGSAIPQLATATLPGSVGHGEYSLYQKNLLFSNATPGMVRSDIARTAPDFVTLQELSERNLSALESLLAEYPGSIICRGNGPRGVAVLTRHKLSEVETRCYPDLNLALARVDLGHKKIWVASVHLRWPFPYKQWSQAREIEEVISKLDGEIVVGGDFNMVRSGYSVARIERAAGSRVAGRISVTFPRFSPLVPLAIDHVLVPSTSAAEVEKRPLLGSDHHGLLARFRI